MNTKAEEITKDFETSMESTGLSGQEKVDKLVDLINDTTQYLIMAPMVQGEIGNLVELKKVMERKLLDLKVEEHAKEFPFELPNRHLKEVANSYAKQLDKIFTEWLLNFGVTLKDITEGAYIVDSNTTIKLDESRTLYMLLNKDSRLIGGLLGEERHSYSNDRSNYTCSLDSVTSYRSVTPEECSTDSGLLELMSINKK